jgi:hypothetical protein
VDDVASNERPAGPPGYKMRRPGAVVTSGELIATHRRRAGQSEFRSCTPYPQRLHSMVHQPPHGPPPVHTLWMPVAPTVPLRCRPVRPTPLYDQLRGERINADLPASEADPQPGDHPGKHRLTPGRPGPPAEASAQSPRAGADRAADWSRSTAIEPAAQSVVNATSRTQSDGETHRHGRTRPATHRATAAWGPQAALPPPAHPQPPPGTTRQPPPAPQPAST